MYDDDSDSSYLKKKIQTYKINPAIIPRPSEFLDIYKNDTENSEIYYSNLNSHPPHSTSKFRVIETDNSSCRLIRSSLINLQIYPSKLINSNLSLSLYIQPFAEFQDGEKEIPKIKLNNGIYRCKYCHSYINPKYKIIYKSNKKYFICNICTYENEIEINVTGMKNEYFLSNINEPEYKIPTIDYIPNQGAFNNNINFKPYYCIMVDITIQSLELNYPQYIFNSFQNNFDYFTNGEESHICFVLFNCKNLYFPSLNIHKELRITAMNDLNNPFCPLSNRDLFYNVITSREDLSILIEKINNFLQNLYSLKDKNKKYKYFYKNDNDDYKLINSILLSGASCLENTGGRVMLFTLGNEKFQTSDCMKNMNTISDVMKKLNEKENVFNDLIEKCNKKIISIDYFIFGNLYINLNIISTISSLTGGELKYYKISFNNNKEITNLNCQFEKLHYDISRILTRQNYYNVEFNIRHSISVGLIEIISGFKRKAQKEISLFNCDPDTSIICNFSLNSTLKKDEEINFQIAISFIDCYNNRYIRILNYSCTVNEDINEIYSHCDFEVLFKSIVTKQICFLPNNEYDENRKILINKIIQMFYFYKKETKRNKNAQLVLPSQIKYLPLLINSFFKKGFFTQSITQINMNTFFYDMYKILKYPLYDTMLFLYPKFYEIDYEDLNTDIMPNKIRLSADVIKLNKLYIGTNGIFIDLFIFNEINNIIIQKLFYVGTFDECLNNNIREINSSAYDCNDTNIQFILHFIDSLRSENYGNYLPIRIHFLDSVNYLNEAALNDYFVEDNYLSENNYPDFLFYLHNLIEKKFEH